MTEMFVWASATTDRILPLSPADTEVILDAGFALIPDAPRRKHGDEPSPGLLWIGEAEALSHWRGSEIPSRTTRATTAESA